MKASNATSKETEPSAGPPGSGASSSSTAKRFTLTAPSLPLDERVHAYRRDIADIALAGQLFAPHYARPMMRRCGPVASAVLKTASSDAATVTDLAPGDEFAVLDIAGGWAWGYRRSNHCVGYVPAADLEDLG